jgi:apolipoprotein N-acyltransferase
MTNPHVWAVDFLWAGTSSFLLLTVHLYESFWPLALVALVPFLMALSRASWSRSARLWLLLAASYLGALYGGSLLCSPLIVLCQTALAVVIVGVCGMALQAARVYLGFHPIIVGLGWVAIEYLLITESEIGSIVAADRIGPHHFKGLTALFGFLVITFVIVLVNSLLAVTANRLREEPASGRRLPRSAPAPYLSHLRHRIPTAGTFLLPDGRGPPSLVMHLVS